MRVTPRLDDAVALVEQVAAGELTPGDVAIAVREAGLRAGGLNAFVEHTLCGIEDRAQATTDGPLRGLPVAVKDSFDTEQLPTTAGTPAMLGRRPSRDSGAVAALRAAGAFVAGKNTLHELSFGITSNNAWTGPVRNPVEPRLIAGGSSGGTAAAVAAGVTPVGLGGDTSGSVRLPAAMCGVVGHRPSAGRYPGDGIVPLSHSRDTAGIIARSVAGVRLVDAVLAGCPTTGPGASADAADPTDPTDPADAARLALGLPVQYWHDLHPCVEAVCRRTASLLADRGVRFVDVDLRTLTADSDELAVYLILHEFPRDLAAYLARESDGLTIERVFASIASPDVRDLAQACQGSLLDPAFYEECLVRRAQLQAVYAAALAAAGVTALLFPTAALPACPLGDDETTLLCGNAVPTLSTYVRHVNLAGTIGHPAISLPAGRTDDGRPVGIELDGLRGQDAALLETAQTVEAVLRTTRPPTGSTPDAPPPAGSRRPGVG